MRTFIVDNPLKTIWSKLIVTQPQIQPRMTDAQKRQHLNKFAADTAVDPNAVVIPPLENDAPPFTGVSKDSDLPSGMTYDEYQQIVARDIVVGKHADSSETIVSERDIAADTGAARLWDYDDDMASLDTVADMADLESIVPIVLGYTGDTKDVFRELAEAMARKVLQSGYPAEDAWKKFTRAYRDRLTRG